MTYTVKVGSPKHLQATRFAAELDRALRARGVTKNELGRSSGVGHTAIDHYSHAAILPRIATAEALAEALDWPRLADLVRYARQSVCHNRLCRQMFLNDAGGNKIYCGHRCRDVAEKLRAARTKTARIARLEAAGEKTPGQTVRAIRLRFNGVIREYRERGDELQAAIDEMCRSCEPEGMCRTPDCALRLFSPLPLQGRQVRQPVPERILASERQSRPETRIKRSASMKRRHAEDPTLRRKGIQAYLATETPEMARARAAKAMVTRKERHGY